MKKLLFILLAVSLTANAYAIDLSAQVIGAFNAFGGTFNPNAFDQVGGDEHGRVRIEGSAEVDNFGGWFRLQGAFTIVDETDPTAEPVEVERLGNTSVNAYGHIWYKPIDQLAFYITKNPDGHWGLDGNALWGFHGIAGDVFKTTDAASLDKFSYSGSLSSAGGALAVRPGFNSAFYGGFSDGAFVSITPIEILTINLGLPVFDEAKTGNMLLSATLQVVLNLGEKGTIGLTYAGDLNKKDVWDDASSLYLYFNTTIGKTVFDFGFGTKFAEKTDTRTINYPISLGAAAIFDLEKMDLKARLLMSALGSTQFSGDRKDENEPLEILAEIVPSFALTEKITAYLKGGLTVSVADSGENRATFGIDLFPYIVFGDTDTVAFYTGFNLRNRDVASDFITWSIPVGISINF